MNRIWLLLAIMVLAAGCSQDSVVKNDTSGTSEDTTTATDAETETQKAKQSDTADSDEADAQQDEAVADSADADSNAADVADTDTDTDTDTDADEDEADVEEEEELSPQQMLGKLQRDGANPEEFLAFAEKNAGTGIGFNALRILAQRQDLEAEAKAKLLDMMKTGYLQNAESDDMQAMTAAMMLLGLGEDEDRNEITEALIGRFVAGKESLDMNASRVLGIVMQQGSDEAKQKVAEQVLENFADDEGLLSFVQQMSRGIPSPSSIEFLKTLIDKTTADSVKGMSMMSLAQIYAGVPDAKGYVKDPRFQAAFPAETIEFIKDFNPDEYADEIEKLLTTVKNDFGDVETRRGTLGEMAEGELFVIQHLSIGKEAPDIIGEDLDGEEFKLSDYRGKVVMLDFWGDW